MYLQRRRRVWYAFHDIPADLREALGGAARFTQTLQTEDRKAAERRAAPLKAKWLAVIEEARKGGRDHIEQDAEFWRRTLLETPDEYREMTLDAIADERQTRIDRALDRAGFMDHREEGAMDLPEVGEAYRFEAIATGKIVRLDAHVDEWIGTLTNEAKTKDMKKATVLRFAEEFPYVSDVKGKDVQRWVNRLASQEGKKAKTLQRILSELRGYWSYLISLEVVSRDHLPFEKLTMPQEGKRGAGSESWLPFSADDVVSLLRAAEAKGDMVLADLIRLGMWTGGRIESLCALRVEEVREDAFDILHDKSQAGRRTIPIHSKLKPIMARLVENAGDDGYVLPGLTMNKYGDRSDAIGKRFGRLKTDKKFGPLYVFHSIRKTVATLLENAGVPENVAADIVGHDKPTMTYGLYSGGASLEVKREALERIDYPGG